MWQNKYFNIALIFLAWSFCIYFIFFIGHNFFPHSQKASSSFFSNLSNWDGDHFKGIAEFGYQENFQYAFFPLYPILVNLAAKLVKNYLIGGLAVSYICTFISLIVFFKLVKLKLGIKKAYQSLIWLLIFPTSFYLLLVYSESLFFLLSLLSFYNLFKFQKKKQTKYLIFSTIFVSLVCLTRLTGIAVLLAFFWEVWLQKLFKKKYFFLFLAPLGLFTYCLFLYIKTGNPFYFITAEKEHWQRLIVIPGVNFWQAINLLIISKPLNINIVIDLSISVLGIGLVIKTFRFLPKSLAIFGLVSIILPLITPSLSSMPRFVLVIFPIFMMMSYWKNFWVKIFFRILFIGLLGFLAVNYINGFWVS